jgi:acetylornithine deacetylase
MEEDIYKEAIILLKKLISIPSFSEEENLTAKLIGDWFDKKKIVFERIGNNLWAKNKFFDQNKPTILLWSWE